MNREPPHPDALRNFDRAIVPEDKILNYALREPNKSRMFGLLGFSRVAGNWEALRDAILGELPRCPAVFEKENEWGAYYGVDVVVTGPNGKRAPVRTHWIYLWGHDRPTLATLLVDAKEWRRWDREGETPPA